MTQYDPKRHHRRSVRLRGCDYSRPGAYFVTINVKGGECALGDVVDGYVQCTDLGRIAHDFWAQVPVRFPYVSIDQFVVIPNHVHAIIVIHEVAPADKTERSARRGRVVPPRESTPPQSNARRGRGHPAPDTDTANMPRRRRATLGHIIAFYKYETTRQINARRGNEPAPFWQRSFYDHVVRDRRGLDAIRAYIANNPLHWELDPDHPNNLPAARKGYDI
jgi:REP element-mobilizing transposase RayT